MLKSPAVKTSGISTMFLSSDPNELCDRLELLLQEKRAGNNSNIIIEEIVAIIDEFLEYRSINPSEHKIKKKLISCTQGKKVKQVCVYTNIIFSTCLLT